jgi:CRP/FNR family transcriptional regulator
LEDLRNWGSAGLYVRGQVIFTEHSTSDGLYILCQGLVKLYHCDRFGRNHILDVVGPGAVLGELLEEPGQTFSVSAEALSDAQLCFLPRQRLIQLIERHPAGSLRLIKALSRQLAAARRKAGSLALKGAESRLAEVVAHLAAARGALGSGTYFPLGYTRRDLAEMVGVSTETAIRLLSRLEKKGVITSRGKEVLVSDAARLVRIADAENIFPSQNGGAKPDSSLRQILRFAQNDKDEGLRMT